MASITVDPEGSGTPGTEPMLQTESDDQLTYEDISEGSTINIKVWKANVDINLWDDYTPDITSADITKKELTTYVANAISEYSAHGYEGYHLEQMYVSNFEGWTEEIFKKVNRTFLNDLLGYMATHGINVPRDGSVALKMERILLGTDEQIPTPAPPARQPPVTVTPTPDPREDGTVRGSREQTADTRMMKQETPTVRTPQPADPRYVRYPVSNPGLPDTHGRQDITLYPSPVRATPEPVVRVSGSPYCTEYDVPPKRVIYPGKTDISKVVTFTRVWKKENNYTGRPYDIFIDKVRMFIGTCRRLDITADQYHAVFPDILSGRALDYFLNYIGPEKRWDEMYDIMDSHFNTTVNHNQYFTDWTGTTYDRTRAENIDKKPAEILEMLLDKLQLAQRALGEGFQGEIPLHTTVVRACRGVPELEPALIHQKPTCEGLFSDLRAALNVAIDRKTAGGYLTDGTQQDYAPESYMIDRRFRNNRTRGNRPTYGNRPPYQNSRLHRQNHDQRLAGPSRPRPSYGGKQFQKGTCRVCNKQGCWSTNHSTEEQNRAKAQYFQACETVGQEPLSQEAYETFVQDWEGYDQELDEEDDIEDVDPDDARRGIAHLTDAAFLHRLTGEDIYTADRIVRADQFSLTGQYSQTYQGELWDTGAAQISTVGKCQAEAYVRENPDARIDWTPGGAEIKFGNSTPISSIGTIDVRNKLGTTRYYILETHTPFLMSLEDADRHKAYFNNILDVIVRSDGETLPVVRKWGHPFFNVSRTEATIHLTEGQLRHLHRRFGHPRTERLYNLLKNSGHDDVQPAVLDEIRKFCSQCQAYDPAPRRFKFSLLDEYDFNYEVVVDVIYINGRNVLHVIDTSTSFQAATFLKGMSARDTWNALCRCWIYVYQGPPDRISHDPGTHFQGEFRDHARVMGISCKQMPIEAHWAVGKIERSHAPLRRVFDILWKELGDRTDQETVLQMAVKALNDTAGPDGLVPTLLVFGAYPRIDEHSPPSPEIQARAEAVRKAMKMLRKIRADVDIARALNTRSGPYVHDTLTLPLRSEVMVWRERLGWTGPYRIAAIEGRTVKVDTPDGPKEFRATQVKQYFRDTSPQEVVSSRSSPDRTELGTQASEDLESPELESNNPELRSNNQEIEREPEVQDCIVVATPGGTKCTEGTKNPKRQLRERTHNQPREGTHERSTLFLTQKERENYDLAVRLREDGVITSAGPPFQESDREEIDQIVARGIVEFTRYSPTEHGSLRIFKTRLVREVKGKNTKPYEKSRMVLQGYGDVEKEEILTQSPTVQRMSQRLVLALGPTLILQYHARGELRDITQAYTQSHDKLKRAIYAYLPKEITRQYPKGTILRIVSPLYGLAESGLYWFKTYHDHHVRRLGMSISTYDPCLLFTTDGQDTFGITAMQTDDTLSFATAPFSQKEEEKLAEAAFRAKPKEFLSEDNPIEFNGGKIQLDSHDILFQQKGQASQLRPVDHTATDRDQQYISQRARGAYVASICQPEASYDLSAAAQVQTPEDKDIEDLNARIEWQIQNPKRGLRYIPLDLNRAKLYIFTDGSFANNKDLTSQLGYLIVLGQETGRTREKFEIQGNIVHWSSTKCKRITRSVLASELYGMISGVDSGIALSTTLRRIVRSLGTPEIPMVLCTDSRSLYECLVKLGTTHEKRLMIDIMSLRESYERREIAEICWVDGRDNPADAFTKKTPNKALEQLVSTNTLTVRVEAYVERPTPQEG